MGSISNIVNVQITRQTSVPTRVGFGTGAFLSSDASFTTQTKVYSSLSEVTSDSEAGTDTANAAAAYFGQQLAPTKLTVIRILTDQVQIDVITFSEDFVSNNAVTGTIDGVVWDGGVYDDSGDPNDFLEDIAGQISVDANVATAVADTVANTITVTYADNESHALVVDTVTGGPTNPTSTVVTTQAAQDSTDLAGALAAAVLENNDWYGLGIFSRVSADIESVSDWVQGQGANNPKLFFAQSADDTIPDNVIVNDIASTLQTKANFRSSVWYHALDGEYLDMGLMGGQLPTDAGSITWAYKSISGVTVDSLSDSQKNAAHAKAANTYDTVASVNITEEGKVSDSPFEWIDVIRGVDWVQTNMATDLFELLRINPKVPYDAIGIGQVEAVVRNRLRLAQEQGILSLDSEPVVITPDISSISASDKANRVLNDVEFSGVLAGAIQKINVKGTVSLI